jgi:SAM-dependent methyltransferase
MKLNLGCGNHFPEGWINADLDSYWHEEGKDVSLVRGEPLPWENDTFDQIMLFHVMNHVPLDEMDGFLSEVERVLGPEGRLLVIDENYPNGVPDYKKDGVADGPPDNVWIDAWLCYQGSLDMILRQVFPYTETLWSCTLSGENEVQTKDTLFTQRWTRIGEGGWLDWTDDDGLSWAIKGIGRHSCMIMAHGW